MLNLTVCPGPALDIMFSCCLNQMGSEVRVLPGRDVRLHGPLSVPVAPLVVLLLSPLMAAASPHPSTH